MIANCHLGFNCVNVEESIKFYEKYLGMDETYQMWMHDPDGNKFEFMQYTEKSYQLVGRPE